MQIQERLKKGYKDKISLYIFHSYRFLCSKCQQKYDKKHISYRYRINMTVSDRTQVSNVIVFGHCLESFFGTSATKLKRLVQLQFITENVLDIHKERRTPFSCLVLKDFIRSRQLVNSSIQLLSLSQPPTHTLLLPFHISHKPAKKVFKCLIHMPYQVNHLPT